MSSQSITYTKLAMHQDFSATAEKATVLKNVIRIPVVLAAEMIQYYHIDELPSWIQDQFPERYYISVFKPFGELVKAIQDVEKIPFVIPHSEGTFLKELSPFEFELPNYIQEDEVVGWVKELYADTVNKCIKGIVYITLSKINDSLIEKLERGDIVDVSIGFAAIFSGGGYIEDKWGYKDAYELSQIDIILGHLAGLPNSTGKCSSDLCGLNHDSDHQFLADMSRRKNTFYDNKGIKEACNLSQANIAHIFNFVDSKSQPIFDIKKPDTQKAQLGKSITPKYQNSVNITNSDFDTTIKNGGKKLMTLEEQLALLQTQFQDLQKKNEELVKEQTDSKVNELSDSNKDLAEKHKLALATIKSLQTEKQTLTTTIEDNKKIIDEVNKAKKKKMVDYFVDKKLEGYGEADLVGMSICDLTKIYTYAKSFESKDADKNVHDNGLQKGGTQEEYENGHKDGNKPKYVSTSMDMNQIAELRKKKLEANK